MVKKNTGIAFDSSGGLKLPISADHSPDSAWITVEKWNVFTSEQKAKFIPLLN